MAQSDNVLELDGRYLLTFHDLEDTEGQQFASVYLLDKEAST